MHLSSNGTRHHNGTGPHRRQPALPPPPGQGPLLLALLIVGFVLMAIQLWLLTVALDLLLAGAGAHVWQLALASGLIFLGGLLALQLLRPRPRAQAAATRGRLR